ncbi:MAG: DUF2817 domain-containing protein [Spirochaetia bacterium]|nr:DUF2817 domain-containing protein [Spirochaetia bacterium]
MKLPASKEIISVGASHGARPIELTARGAGSLPVLMIGGVHGDETEGFLLAERFVAELDAGNVSIPEGITLYICPRLNPDGCAHARRTNQRNVDLNRNLPTRDWTGEFTNPRYYPGPAAGSEPESAATLTILDAVKPAVVVSLHSWENPMINYNGPCLDLAEAMSKDNALPPKGDIGYPTPGSLGTYAGWERSLPTITLEILRGQDPETVWNAHKTGLITAFAFYLSHARPLATV